MSLRDIFRRKEKYLSDEAPTDYCTSCFADLTKQEGFDRTAPYWVCTGCRQVLIRPDLDWKVIWKCDGCNDLLNAQEGFSEDCGEWTCRACGRVNPITKKEIYASEAEYLSDMNDPLRGISDEAALELSRYMEVDTLGNTGNIRLVRNVEDGKLYVEKFLEVYDKNVYLRLMDEPLKNMPRIKAVYEGNGRLAVVEEYIPGKTLEEILKNTTLGMADAGRIAKKVCNILKNLHELPTPIIHRDVKPSNIILTPDGEVYLLDMNASKMYKQDENNDTRYLGTMGYAAPEQVGYGFSASSPKTDIYALGMLLNVMVTGHFPKDKKAQKPLFSVIEKCIKLDADERYSDAELIEALENIG